MPISDLSYGYEKPRNPTTGDVFWEALERNIQRMNNHSHNGVDGAQIAATIGDVLAADWGADLGGGTYRQLIQLPEPMEFDSTRIEVRRSTGEISYPEIVKVSDTTFYIYTNDVSAAYKVSYL